MDLITKRISASRIKLPEWAYEAMEEHGIDKDEAQLIRKGYTMAPEDVQFKEGERSSVDYITTKARDRDGEIVLPKGAILDDYRKNPVVLFGHDYKSLPVGKSVWIKSDEKGLISKTKYANTQKADEIFQYRKEGFPLAKSIGFVPLETVEEKDFKNLDLKELGLDEADLEGTKRIYPKWLMLEYSDVPVPSNPEALQLAISKGLFTLEDAVISAEEDEAFVLEIAPDFNLEEEEPEIDKMIKDIEEEEVTDKRKKRKDKDEEEAVAKPETTENFHHIPIKSAGSFVSDSLKIIDISKEKKIKAVIGKLKSDPDGSTHIQKYLFDASKWSMADAKKWASEHKDATVEEGLHGTGPGSKPRKPKREMEDIHIKFETATNVHKNGEAWLNDDVKERWNKSLSKSFDVTEIEDSPSTAIYDIVGKYLDCKIKDIYQSHFMMSGALLGCYLSALRESTKDFVLEDVRNFNHAGSESPPVYEVIQLNSKMKDDFLIEGMSFYKVPADSLQELEGTPIVMRLTPTWAGISLVVFTKREERGLFAKIIKDMKAWVQKNNFLKGEKFALSGEFLEKTDDDWSNLFLTDINEKAIRRTVELINKKKEGLPNRGILLMGPPGTGKTLSGRVTMNTTETTFIWVSSRDFMYSGSSGGISFGFELARDLAPTVLLFEDIDNWLYDRAIDLLKTEMDGLKKSKGVVTILTSNYPERLPDALIDRPGRFHDVLNFDLPDPVVRARMVKSWAVGISNKMIAPVVNSTRGFSGAHIFELISFAKLLMEEEDIDLDTAIKLSFKKMTDQKLLIERVREGGKEEKGRGPDEEDETVIELVKENALEDVDLDEFDEDDLDFEADLLIEKEGRIISSKNRKTMTRAIESMEAATADLKQLVHDTNPDKEETLPAEDLGKGIEIVDEEIEEVEEKEMEVAFDADSFGENLSGALKLVIDATKIDPAQIIQEKIDLVTGKVF